MSDFRRDAVLLITGNAAPYLVHRFEDDWQ